MKYSSWSKPKQERFLNTWLVGFEGREWMVGDRESRDFAALEKKLRDSGLVDFSNIFESRDVMRHYFAGEHLVSVEQWGVFLFLNYKNIQTRLSWIMEKAHLYNYTDAERFSLGLQCKFPKMFHVSFTHDLEKIEVIA